MSNLKFLRAYPLEILVKPDKVDQVRATLATIGQHHRLFWKEENEGDCYKFTMTVETTSFANGYFMIGQFFEKHKVFYL